MQVDFSLIGNMYLFNFLQLQLSNKVKEVCKSFLYRTRSRNITFRCIIEVVFSGNYSF